MVVPKGSAFSVDAMRQRWTTSPHLVPRRKLPGARAARVATFYVSGTEHSATSNGLSVRTNTVARRTASHMEALMPADNDKRRPPLRQRRRHFLRSSAMRFLRVFSDY